MSLAFQPYEKTWKQVLTNIPKSPTQLSPYEMKKNLTTFLRLPKNKEIGMTTIEAATIRTLAKKKIISHPNPPIIKAHLREKSWLN